MPGRTFRCLGMLIGLMASLFCFGSARANDASLLYSDDPTLMWTEWDLIRNGEAPPTSIYPVTRAEFQKDFTKTVVQEPPVTRNMIGFTLRPMAGSFQLSMLGPISRQGQTLTPAAALLYWSLPPSAVFSDDMFVGDWFHLRIAMDQRFDAGKMAGAEGSLFPAYLFESNMPREGYLTVADKDLSLTIGRLRSGIGHGFFGNTFLNGKANFYDQIQFTASANDFKYFFMFGMSDPLLTPDEQTIQNTRWDFPVFNEPHKSFAYHRIEYRPLPQVVFGLGEANMIGGITPDLKNILPFNIWHNTYSYGYKNVMMVADASVVPFPGVHLFGEFLMDDLKLGREGSGAKPTALGWQLGARYVLPWGQDFRYLVGAEYTHIDPWTYNAFSPYLMFYQRQTYCSSVNDWYMDFPMGYAYGTDLDHYGVYAQMLSSSGAHASLSYSHMVQGQADLGAYDATSPWYDQYDTITLTNGHVGVAEISDTVSLSLKYPVWRSISVTALGSYSFLHNAGHVPAAVGSQYVWMVGVEYQY